MNLILLYLSILPSVLLGYYIYKKDPIEKEPFSLLLRSFIGGIIGGILIIILSISFDIQNYSLESLYHTLFYSFVLVALLEEGIKFIIAYLMCYKNKEFNYQYDGIVYASFVSLGFATYENVLFVFRYNSIQTALYRGILTVPAHVFFAIFMGYYLGLAKHDRLQKKKKQEEIELLKALIVPTILHGFFDFCLFSGNLVGLLFFLIFVLLLYMICFKKVREVSNSKRHI